MSCLHACSAEMPGYCARSRLMPKKKTEGQGDDRQITQHSGRAYGAYKSRCLSYSLGTRSFQNDGCIGQSEDTGTRTDEALCAHDQPERGVHIQKGRAQQPHAAQNCPHGADDAAVVTIAEARRQRAGQSLNDGLRASIRPACCTLKPLPTWR